MTNTLDEHKIIADKNEEVKEKSTARLLVNKKLLSKSECAICLENFELGQRVSCSQTMACEHIYHEQCLSTWLMKNDYCPCCRVTLIDSKTILESDPADENVKESSEDSLGDLDQDQDLNPSQRGNEESTLPSIQSIEEDFSLSDIPLTEENDIELALERDTYNNQSPGV